MLSVMRTKLRNVQFQNGNIGKSERPALMSTPSALRMPYFGGTDPQDIVALGCLTRED